MAVRMTNCPECSSRALKVLEELNPETTDMNMRVKLRCTECKHEWEGKATSPHHLRQREMGFVI